SVYPKLVRAGWYVQVTGKWIMPNAVVSFRGIEGTRAPPTATAQTSARVPMLAGGPVDVTVTNPGGGTATLAGAITFVPASVWASANAAAPGDELSIS